MIHILASGVLIGTPQTRTSSKGNRYCIGSLKSSGKDGDAFVSFICFAEDLVADLLELRSGDGLAIAGPGKFTAWTGKDGQEKHGLSVVVDRLLPNKPNPKPKVADPKPAPARSPAEEFNDAIPF